MPAVEFLRSVGTRFRKGDIANLPLSTLKGLAQEMGVADWTDLVVVRAEGADVHDFMNKWRRQQEIGRVEERSSPGKEKLDEESKTMEEKDGDSSPGGSLRRRAPVAAPA